MWRPVELGNTNRWNREREWREKRLRAPNTILLGRGAGSEYGQKTKEKDWGGWRLR
jgi:hypothetical protein